MNIIIDFEISLHLPMEGISDLSWLRDNLYCAVGNAVKFSDSNGDGVKVSIQYTNTNSSNINSPLDFDGSSSANILKNDNHPSLKVIIQDSGILLSTEALQNFFNQPQQSNRTQMGGMGQGVYCLKERITALGGDCGVHTRPDGNSGTVVWFSIPFPEAKSNETGSVKILPTLFHTVSRGGTSRGTSIKLINDKNNYVSSFVRFDGNNNHQNEAENNSSNLFVPFDSNYRSLVQAGGGKNGLNSPKSNFRRFSNTEEYSSDNSTKISVLDGLHILVVDDSVPILKMMCKVLRQANAIVVDAKNGQDALDQFINLRQGKFDIVITDIQVKVVNKLMINSIYYDNMTIYLTS